MVFIGDSDNTYDSKNRWHHRKIHPHWNWKQKEQVKVIAFTNCQEVELFSNGKSLGSKFLSDNPDCELIWETEFKPGDLNAVGRIEGKEKASFKLQTYIDPSHLIITSDKKTLRANNKDVAHLEVLIADEEGVIDYFANNKINCNLNGPIRLLGMEDANAKNTENYSDNEQNAYKGRLLVYIQSLDRIGKGIVKISSKGLKSKEFVIYVVEN